MQHRYSGEPLSVLCLHSAEGSVVLRLAHMPGVVAGAQIPCPRYMANGMLCKRGLESSSALWRLGLSFGF